MAHVVFAVLKFQAVGLQIATLQDILYVFSLFVFDVEPILIYFLLFFYLEIETYERI